MTSTDQRRDTGARTRAYWRASLLTSLGTLALLAFGGSSIVAMLTSVGGAAILALLVTGWILAFTTAVRTVLHGRPDTVLRFSGGLLVSFCALLVSVVLLLGTVSGTIFIRLPLDLTGPERTYATAMAMAPWRLPVDSSTDPVEAGLAVWRLGAEPGSTPSRSAAQARIVPFGTSPWPGRGGTPMPPDVFPALTGGANAIPPSLIDSLPRRLSPAERAFLDAVANAPEWAAVAPAARAREIDLLSGARSLPLGDSIDILEMPILNGDRLRRMAQANAARIAYHLQRGDAGAARTAAQELVSLGLGLLEGSHSLVNALSGTILVAQGREQLFRTLRLLGDPDAERIDAVRRQAAENRRMTAPQTGSLAAAVTMRDSVLRAARAPTPPPMRWEMLRILPSLACGNTREIVLGPAADVREAFGVIRAELARTAVDSAWIEVAESTLERRGREEMSPYLDRALRLPHRIARLIGSRRLAACLSYGYLL